MTTNDPLDAPPASPLDGPDWICNEAVQAGDVLVLMGTPFRVTAVTRGELLLGIPIQVTGHEITLRDLPVKEVTHPLPVGKFVFLASRPRAYTGRYWMGWYTRISEFRAPFPEWNTGETSHDPPWYTCTGDVRAPNPLAAFEVVRTAYPDAVPRFASERDADWTPGERFPTAPSPDELSAPTPEGP